jgi:ATP-binding cassette subfamily C (CFTR/MRP) protein 1
LDSDRIVVLQQGRAVEFDTPATLVKKRGLFYDLVKEANLVSSFE